MLVAVVARSPVFGGKLKSFDAKKAKEVKGVRHVVQIDRIEFPVLHQNAIAPGQRESRQRRGAEVVRAGSDPARAAAKRTGSGTFGSHSYWY